jgi:hypothetical protein
MNIIYAPHCDDEIIGCFELICNPDEEFIIYYTHPENMNRIDEAKNLKSLLPNIKDQLFDYSFSTFEKKYTYYFPDPVYETHPDHRQIGAIGESVLRSGYNVIFYSINMKAPYIHKVKNPDNKEFLLNQIYPLQNKLWEYDKTFILFEGRCKWLI